VCMKTLQRRRSQRILQGFESESSGGTTSRRTRRRELKVKELAEKKEDKGRGLWELGILPRLGRKCTSSGGSTAAVRSAGEEIWTVGFYVQGASEKHTEGGDREPLDLIQKSRQPLDRTGGARGLTLLTPRQKSRQVSGYRRS
jgi:hypothetical protein